MWITKLKYIFSEVRWLIKKLNWIRKGRLMLKYPGFNCGCCGKWVDEAFEIPEYQSAGQWWDTWGLCNKCARGDNEV